MEAGNERVLPTRLRQSLGPSRFADRPGCAARPLSPGDAQAMTVLIATDLLCAGWRFAADSCRIRLRTGDLLSLTDGRPFWSIPFPSAVLFCSASLLFHSRGSNYVWQNRSLGQ